MTIDFSSHNSSDTTHGTVLQRDVARGTMLRCDTRVTCNGDTTCSSTTHDDDTAQYTLLQHDAR